MKGLIHCHSQDSRYDSTMDVKTLCTRAKAVGYEAVTLTDHGTLTGIDDFISAAHEVGIKPIPGVEAYVQEEDSPYKRFHLILLAKDDLGYQGIGKAVSDSNKKIDSGGFPRMNKEILNKYFGPGKKYHDHVIATSACVGGVLAGLLLSPLEFYKEINKLTAKMDKYENPDSKTYKGNKEILVQKEAELEDMVKFREDCSIIAKKPYKKKEKALEKLKTTASEEEYKAAFKLLEDEKKETEVAIKALDDIRAKISLMKKDITIIKGKIKDSEESQKKYLAIQNEIELIKEKINPDDVIYEKVLEEARQYDDIFGHGNFFIEMQYHGYLTDDESEEIEVKSMPQLLKIADTLSIPISAANDAHIPDNSTASLRARQIISSIRYAKKGYISSIRKGDDQIYIKSEGEMLDALMNIMSKERAEEAIENSYKICESCNCDFKYGTHYPKFKGILPGETADDALRRMALVGVKKHYTKECEWTKEYQERFEHELRVIASMGYSDYFLIVQDFLEFGRKLGHLNEECLTYLREKIKELSLEELVEYVNNHQTEIGFVVGAGRGSAAGSLIAYLVGITDIIDPLKYDLLFERFLNEDRVSMPDVDSDFSPEIRELVIEYCKKLYGLESVTNIVTKGFMQPKGAVRNTARVLGIERDKREYYLSLSDRIAKMIPSKVGMNFETCEPDLREAFAEKPTDTEEQIQYKKDANEIIDHAKLVEGAFLNYGMHAAGVIIADGNPIDDYVPLMRDDKSGDMKVQCNMVQAEEIHGLLKFDFLGLRNLNIVTLAIRSIAARTGEKIDVEHIPFEDEVFEKIFATGKTGSVFQFESSGMKKMLKSAKPNCLEDIIALVSLYRPGPMDFIPRYIEGKTNSEGIKYLCPELKPILSKTYGVIVYQEQVMEIVQKLAGFSLSQADNVRRYMSKKKMEKLEHERESFINGDEKRGIDGCVKRGVCAEVANKIFDQMVEFAKYAFNKSHAAAYAVLSYITAYLKYHFPADYMCAVLQCTDDTKKMPSVLNDCREIGVKVLPPNVNKSDLHFTVVDREILFGLNSVKGTKIAYARKIIDDRNENGEYTSFKDFLKRAVADKSTTENLIAAGTMDEFHPNRYAMLKAYETGGEIVSKIVAKKNDILEMDKVYEESKDKKRFINSYNKAKETLDVLEKQFDILRIVDSPEDRNYRMIKEKEVLGFFVTAHPLDEYRLPDELGCITIDNLDNAAGEVDIMGIIENFEIKRRKTDNKPMAFFDLEDKTGIIHVCCFTKSYEQNEELLAEDRIIKLTGMINVNVDEMSGESEMQIFMDTAKLIQPDLDEKYIVLRDMSDWPDTFKRIRSKGYLSNEGHPLIIMDKLNGEFRNTKYYVSEKISNDKSFITEI